MGPHTARAQQSAAAAVGLSGGNRAGSSGMYGCAAPSHLSVGTFPSGGKNASDPITYITAPHNPGKHPPVVINPSRCAPNQPPTKTAHHNPQTRQPMIRPGKISK